MQDIDIAWCNLHTPFLLLPPSLELVLVHPQIPLSAPNKCVFLSSSLGCSPRPACWRSHSTYVGCTITWEYREISLIQTTPEYQNITRDLQAVESRKRATGTSWLVTKFNLVENRLAGQGSSATTADWSVELVDNLGQGVYIYVVDTGVYGSHPLLTPRVQSGISLPTVPGTANTEGDGHGTEVAGAAAATGFGVATGATIIPIKIYSSPDGRDLSDLIEGVQEAADDFRSKQRMQQMSNTGAPPAAVINISIEAPNDPALVAVIAEALDLGMHVVIAAGNDHQDRSNNWVTMRTNTQVQAAINVGAIEINDNLSLWGSPTRPGSNFGACVDIYAGGTNIFTSGPNQSTNKLDDGTSLAAPQVAGIIAGVIQLDGNLPPAAMKAKVIGLGATGKIQNLPAGSNNVIAQLPKDEFGDFKTGRR
ncbi:peptidase S8/S53 domain-containing protein [Mycena maculata]|uniref:Peptidase S8/S53 domain-containing protein n=1 Tax=Mycena maculata TaxID=230809 RepID=A0AAD7IKF1_9AGAR|nr:peptidase S8/S53 domain-containing protein [Mycena maculata]